MANITNEINQIKSAIYGEEVRSSIIDGLEAINKESENTTSRQKIVEESQATLTENQAELDKKWNEQIKNITDSNPSNVEIVDSRTSATKGITYTNLNLRLNTIEEDLLSRKINVMYPPAGLAKLQVRLVDT